MSPPLLQSTQLAAVPGVVHGFGGRHGGVSSPPYWACNVGGHVGDDPAAVADNRRAMLAALGRPAGSWRGLEQVHGAEVATFTDAPKADGVAQAPPRADAAVTAHRASTLAVLTADCVPILLATADGSAVGIAHAGWRGTVADVAGAAARRLAALAGGAAPSLRAALGPAIGPCCFVVDGEAAAALHAFGQRVGAPEALVPAGAKWRVDLWALNRAALWATGALTRPAEVLATCTACNPAWFSYRRDGLTGRQAALIARR